MNGLAIVEIKDNEKRRYITTRGLTCRNIVATFDLFNTNIVLDTLPQVRQQGGEKITTDVIISCLHSYYQTADSTVLTFLLELIIELDTFHALLSITTQLLNQLCSVSQGINRIVLGFLEGIDGVEDKEKVCEAVSNAGQLIFDLILHSWPLCGTTRKNGLSCHLLLSKCVALSSK